MRFQILALLLLAGGCISAPRPGAPAAGPSSAHPAVTVAPARPVRVVAPDTAPAVPRRGPNGEPAPRPYAQVVTPEARTREGLFRTHQLGGRLLYEIPRAELGREMLLVTQIASNDAGTGFGGAPAGNRVLRWERRGSQILLRNVFHVVTADSASAIYTAVQAANHAPVLAVFNIEAFGPDSAAVIDVTRLFTAGPPELGPGHSLRGSLDRERSFVERVAAFPDNVEVEAVQTYTVAPPPAPGAAEQSRSLPRTASVLMHWSMIRLPERPMMPRLADRRVGYFAVGRVDYSHPEHGAPQRRYINRWRLEKRDPEAALSEPVKPIEFYVDPATPPQWVPFVKRGIEAWNQAFRAAGFRDAVVAREAPSPEQDPDWSAEDARYSVIRWLPTTVQNARGPHIHDPRTGEILEADIEFHHGYMSGLRDQYFFHVAPLDARAQRLPFPDSLMGRLIQQVITHEVGHSLGLPHNMKASSLFPVDSLRSRAFLARWGHTPSIMDYSRFNYVAQPEDGIPPEDLIRKIGPYDEFAVRWGYAPIPGARTPDEEREVLDGWARAQDEQPWLRFSTRDAYGADPGELMEAVGDADAVRSTELGLRNVRRMVPLLLRATERPGEGYDELAQLYGRVVGQWGNLLGHVVAVVGGAESQEKYAGQPGVRFVPVPRARQVEAMRFVSREAFRTPRWLLDEEVLRRVEPQGAIARVGAVQARLLARLLDERRLQRLVEFEALARDPREVYTLGEMLAELRRGVWSELAESSVRVDPFRRELQRAYLDQVGGRVAGPSPRRPTILLPGGPGVGSGGESRAQLRGELRALDAELARAIPRAADRATRLHLEDARALIRKLEEE